MEVARQAAVTGRHERPSAGRSFSHDDASESCWRIGYTVKHSAQAFVVTAVAAGALSVAIYFAVSEGL